MRRLGRMLKIGCFLGFIFLSLAFLLNTQTGSTLTLKTISIATQQTFKFSSLEGRLLNNFTLHNASYRTKEWIVFADSLSIQWDPKRLLRKTPRIIHLRGKNIYVMNDAKELINIPELSAELISNKNNSANMSLETGLPEIPQMKLFVAGSFSQYAWMVSLLGKQTDWELSGSGNRNSIAFTTTKPTLLNNPVNLAGSIRWSPKLAWDVSLQAPKLNITFLDKNLSGTLSIHSKMNDKNLKPGDDTKDTTLLTLIKNAYLDIDTQLNFDKASLMLRGKLTDHWNINYKLYSGELQNFLNDVSGHIASNGTITGKKFQPVLESTLSINSLRLDEFPDTELESKLDIHAQPTFNQDQLSTFSLKTKIKSLNIQHLIEGKKVNIFADGSFNMNLDKKGLHNHLSLFLYQQKNNPIDVILNFPQFTSWRALEINELLDGELIMSIQSLGLLQSLSPNVASVHGTFKSDFKIKGDLQNPIFSGGAAVDNVTFYLPDIAIKPTANVTLKANHNVLNYSGNISSGEGKILLDGKTLFSEDLSTQVSIKGENFLLSNLLKNKLTVSPDVQLKNHENQWQLKGRVIVPKAYLDFGDARTTSTLPSHAIVISPEGKILKQESLQLMTHLDVIAGNDVTLIFNGLTGKLRGNLLLENAETQLIANGQVTLNGSYDLMGEELSIQDGVLSFNRSPIENPALNLRGSKNILLNSTSHNFTNPETLTVGVLVQGTASHPHISLFSDPAGWSQSDILSMIILGEPASSVSGTDAQLLFKAAQLLSPQKGSTLNKLKAQLRQKFGLTDLRIETGLNNNAENPNATPEKSTSVVVGKSLTPRLYISYSVSIFNALNTFRMKYILGKHWFAQTQTNTAGSGVDLFYTVEK